MPKIKIQIEDEDSKKDSKKKTSKKTSSTSARKSAKEKQSTPKKTLKPKKIKIKEEQEKEPTKAEELIEQSNSVLSVINDLKEEKEMQKKLDEQSLGGLNKEEFEQEYHAESRSLKVYRNIAYFFIFLVVSLLLGVLYFAMVKVHITIIPNQERISNNMIFDVYDKSQAKNVSKDAIRGIVRKVPINYSIDYQATGADVIGKETVGEVTIINNYNQNQPLVATTRLLSPDNKLFRIKETVNVPAGSSVKVEVYADKPSPDMAIGPTKFTIPGLWAGLQDKIYAVSDSDMIYRQKVKKYVTQEDIDEALREIKKNLLSQAKAEVNETYKDYSQIIYKIDENSIVSKVNASVGDEVEEFSVTMDADVIVVAFDEKKAAELAKNKFLLSLDSDKELLSFDSDNIIYSLNNYSYLDGEATVSATFEGKVTLKEDSDIVKKDKILGLKDKELKAYLSELPDVAGYEVHYYPSFIKIVPKLADRIEVEIKK